MFATALRRHSPDRPKIRVEALEDRVMPAFTALPDFGAPAPPPAVFAAVHRPSDLVTPAPGPFGPFAGPFVGFDGAAGGPPPEFLAQVRQIAERLRSGGVLPLPFPAPEGGTREPVHLPSLPQPADGVGGVEPAAPAAPPAPAAATVIPAAGGRAEMPPSADPELPGHPGLDAPAARAEPTPTPNSNPVPDESEFSFPIISVEPAAVARAFAPIRELAREAWAQAEAELPALDLPDEMEDAAPAMWQVGACLVAGAAVWAVAPRRKPAARPTRRDDPREDRTHEPRSD